ncbi:MAG: hemerythrin domain-containing protein [Methanobacterium sp. ERen5]|nr:MAG: hemerythrin domain-containing protein [Methanobacterium sp. ERen5]
MSESKLYNMLEEDHANVKELLTKTVDNETDEHFQTIKEELEAHMKGEEKYFYPEIEDQEKVTLLEAYEEHNLVKLVLKQMDERKTKDDKWFAKANVLKDLIEHHVEEEEEDIFSIAQENLSSTQENKIAEEIEAVKSK